MRKMMADKALVKRFSAFETMGSATTILLDVLCLMISNFVWTGLFKWVKIQHHMSYTCMSILMIMMENIVLMHDPESYMKNIKKDCNRRPKLSLMLMSFKHIIKQLEEKRKGEYMALDL